VTAALDTAAGAVLIADHAVPEGALVLPVETSPTLVNASGKRLSISGLTTVDVTIGILETSIKAWIVPGLPVPLILGTPFIGEYVELILPREKKVTLWDPRSREKSDVYLYSTRRQGSDPKGTSWVRTVAAVCVPPMTEMRIRVRSDRQGLSLIRPVQRRRNPVFMANGLIEVPRDGPWTAWVANMSENPVTLARGQVVGVAEEPPSTCVMVASLKSPAESTGDDPLDDLDLDVDMEDRPKVLEMLRRHSRLWDGHLGNIKSVQHRIPTTGPPNRAAPYRCGLKTRDIVQEELQRMEEMGVIEPSNSEWAAPIVLAPKPDGSLRFCVDYRKLNEVTVRDSYPLPRMDDCLDSLGTAQIFTTLDANCGYWQLEIPEEDRDKTSFISHMGTYRFSRMPFGLVNAPATFQRAMDVLLTPVLWRKAIVYLDDIIIFSSTVEDHIRDVDQVLTMLNEAGVSLKLKKCRFFRRRVDYLGHVIQPGQLGMAAKKMSAVDTWALPRTKRELKSFVAFCSVYRKFVPNFAQIAAPLNKLLKKDAEEVIALTEEVRKAVFLLKEKLTSPPLLALPTRDSSFILETDASNVAIGAALLEVRSDGNTQPVGFYSRSLLPAEKNYSVTEREALAVVWGVKQTRPYLERTKFVVRTDHSALRWLFGASEENQRICRWRLSLAEFSFTVEYRPGKKHVAADTLSRLPARDPTSQDTDLDPPVLVVEMPLQPPPTRPRGGPWIEMTQAMPPLTHDEVFEEQRWDPECQRLAELASQGYPGYGWNAEGLLCKAMEGQRPQVLVPPKLREIVLHMAHLPPKASHPGARRMQANISQEFYWATLRRDCADYVKHCLSCAAVKGPDGRQTRPLQLFPPDGPWEFVCADILGPLPTTVSGHRFVLVISDRFSKFTVAVPMKTTTADDVAEVFVSSWISYFGVPLILLTDNGPQFASKFLQQVSAVLGVQQRFTSAYHPATNGQVERFNRTVLAMLSHYVSNDREWDKQIGPAMVAYNATVHDSTGFSPQEMLRAEAPRVLLSGNASIPPADKGTWRRKFLQNLAVIGKKAKEKLQSAQARYKKAYDAHVRARNATLVAGDWVLVRVFTESPKLTLPLAGPYEILRVDSRNGTYLLNTTDGEVRVASDRVKPAPYPRDLPLGWSPVTRMADQAEEDTTEYVVDRIVSHGRNAESKVVARVRWAGYDSADDTWEDPRLLPSAIVRQYERRKGVVLPCRV
jgi:transposase InsO family protein